MNYHQKLVTKRQLCQKWVKRDQENNQLEEKMNETWIINLKRGQQKS